MIDQAGIDTIKSTNIFGSDTRSSLFREIARAEWQKVRSGFCLKFSENKELERDADSVKTHTALIIAASSLRASSETMSFAITHEVY